MLVTLRSDSGATIVEFAICAILLFMLFGAIFDIGLGMHRYAMLKQVTTETTRQIAVRLQTHRDCSFIETYLRDTASPKLYKHLTPGATPHWQTEWHTSGSGLLFPTFRIRSQMNMECYFLCTMFPQGIPISSSSEIVIERQRIGPGGNGCPPVTI
jgi:hypothetical protein